MIVFGIKLNYKITLQPNTIKIPRNQYKIGSYQWKNKD